MKFILKKGFYVTREDQHICKICLESGDLAWVGGGCKEAEAVSPALLLQLPLKGFIERRNKYHFKPNFPSRRGKSNRKAFGSVSRERTIILKMWQETKELHPHTKLNCFQH